MKRLILAACVFAACAPALAQGGFSESGYKEIQLHRVGKLVGNYQSGHLLRRMSEGVDMTFVADAEADNMRVEARVVEFDYAKDEDRAPSRVLLEGKVTIQIQGSTIRSGKAVIDFESGEAVFTENPQMDAEQMKNLQAKKITVNMDTGDFEVVEGSIESMDPNL